MTVGHLELLVEEPSMGAFLEATLPRLLPVDCTFAIHAFQSKDDLLRKLPGRLRGYRLILPDDWRLIVMMDRDNTDCREVKANLERESCQAALITRTQVAAAWQVVNRVVIEELEAWYFWRLGSGAPSFSQSFAQYPQAEQVSVTQTLSRAEPGKRLSVCCRPADTTRKDWPKLTPPGK